MPFEQMQKKIEQHLTNQKETDVVYLLSTMKTCKNVPDSEFILDYCEQQLASLLPDLRRRKLKKLIESCIYDYESTLDVIHQAIVLKDLKEADRLLKPLIKEAEKVEMFQSSEDFKYFSFKNPFEKELYKQTFTQNATILVTPIPYSSIYFAKAEILILNKEYGKALEALALAEAYNPVDELIHSRTVLCLSELNELSTFMEQALNAYNYSYDKEALARSYYQFGWYCSAKRYYDEAKVLLVISLGYNVTNTAERALKQVSDKLDQPIPVLTAQQKDRASTWLSKYNMEVGPSIPVLKTFESLINKALNHKNDSLAQQYQTLLKVLLLEENNTSKIEIPFEEIVTVEDVKPQPTKQVDKLQEILLSIELGLTNNPVHDMSWLLEQASLYKNSSYNIPVYLQIRDWMEPFLNDSNRISYLRLLDDSCFNYNLILKNIQQLISLNQYEEADQILTDLIHRIEDDHLYEDDDLVSYFSFNDSFESYLYKQLLPTNKAITPTLIPYSRIYALKGELQMKQHYFQKAISYYETALKWNPVDSSLFNCYCMLIAKVDSPKKAFPLAQQGWFIAYKAQDISDSFANIAFLLHLQNQDQHAKVFALRSLCYKDNSSAFTMLKTIAKRINEPFDQVDKQHVFETQNYAEGIDLSLLPSTFILESLNAYKQTIEDSNKQELQRINTFINVLNKPANNDILPLITPPTPPIKESIEDKIPPLPIKLETSEEPIQEILSTLTSSLTGDITVDGPYLERMKQQYATHTHSEEIEHYANRMLITLNQESQDIKDLDILERCNQTLEEASTLLNNKEFKKAQTLLESLLHSLKDQEGMILESLGSSTYSFNTVIEHMIYDQMKNALNKTYATKIPFSNIYHVYALTYIQNHQLLKGKELLEKGLQYNPVSTTILFEYANVLKQLHENEAYFNTLKTLYKVSYTKEDFAHVLLEFGLYFKQQLNLEYATLFLTTSKTYEPSLTAINTLKEIDPPILLDTNQIITIRDTIKPQGYDISPSKEVVTTLINLGKTMQEKGNIKDAKKYYTMLYTLIEDEKIKELIETL